MSSLGQAARGLSRVPTEQLFRCHCVFLPLVLSVLCLFVCQTTTAPAAWTMVRMDGMRSRCCLLVGRVP